MIRTATMDDASVLIGISLRSKRYWGYPEAYFDIWKKELTVTPDYIQKNSVFVAEKNNRPAGYYSLVTLEEDLIVSQILIEKGVWLDHMFVEPAHIGEGLGSKMFQHMCRECKAAEIREVKILADPNSRGFYEKMGCRYVREYSSTIAGRTTPLLIYDV